MKQFNKLMINGTSTSVATSSDAIDASQIYSASVQGVVTGSASAGALKLQGSNDAPFDMNSALPVAAPWAPTHWSDIASATVAIAGATSILVPVTPICHQWLRVVTTQTAAVVQTVIVTADVSGSLNNKYFLINSSTVSYYVWFNINSAGTDPALAGKTGIEVDAATNASAGTIAAALKVAIDAQAGIFTSGSATSSLTITNTVAGSAALATAGTTSFTFSATTFGTISARLKTINV